MTVHFFNPGDINLLIIPSIYNKHIILGLKEKGYDIKLHTLAHDFPFPSDDSIKECIKLVQSVPAGEPVIFDARALAAIPFVLKDVKQHNPLIAVVHIPLSVDPQYSAYQRTIITSLEKEAYSQITTFIATNPYAAEQIGFFIENPEKINVIVPGVDISEKKLVYPDVPVKFLSVANLSRNRDHSILVRAFAALKSRDWALHCYGNFSIDKEYLEELESLINRYGLKNKLFIHENIQGKELKDVFLKADLLIHPSDFEPYGLVPAQALAYGIPVVASTGGGLRNTIPANMGEFFKPGDVYGLQSIIEEFLDNPFLYKKLAARAATYRDNAQTWEKSTQMFEEVLKRLIS